MRSWWLALACLLLAPAASACSAVPPALDLDLPMELKGPCSIGNGAETLDGCNPLPDGWQSYDGNLTWGWNDAPCAAEATPPIEDVILTVSVVRAPAWMTIRTPSLMRITPADQLDPDTYSIDPSASPQRAVAHRVTKPFDLGIAVEREPTADELAELAADGGVATVILRATASESYGWMATLTSELVEFDARPLLASPQPASDASEVVPAPGLLLALAALAGAAILRRR